MTIESTFISNNTSYLLGDRERVDFRHVDERARRGQSVRAATADAEQAVVALDDITVTAQANGDIFIRSDKKGLQMTRVLVRAPALSSLYSCTEQLPGVLLELALQTLHQREGVSSGAGKADNDLTVADTSDFTSVWLDDGGTHRDLAIADHHHLLSLPYTQDSRSMHLWF